MEGLQSATLADQAYVAIRAAITSGELPAGEKITERGLATMLSVSLTPVREAIRRLEQEQLIERRGARTTVVFEPSPTADDEFVQMEAALRALAVRFAATKADAHLIARLEQRLTVADDLREQMVTALAADREYPDDLAGLILLELREFHAELEGACGNAVLVRMLSTVNAFSFRQRAAILRRRVTSGEFRDERYFQHRELLDAVRRGDPDEAERLMLAHARGAADDPT
jgi:DNA-binding GntR family transcriptional regulator